MRLTLMPPAVEPAQAQTIDPKIRMMTANGVQVFESAVANPEVETTETNWNMPWRNEAESVG